MRVVRLHLRIGTRVTQQDPISLDLSLIGTPVASVAEVAREAEKVGFSRIWATESTSDSMLQALAAALATEQISLGTAVTVAFARNPMSVAYTAWDLASVSEGRFTLGLGSQIKSHIQRRFSMPWDSPVDQMRDFINALQAIWQAWDTGEQLSHEGPYYQHTLMTPVFTPLTHGFRIPIALAAVGPTMTHLAGEVADGLILHGMTTPAYLETVTLKALGGGLAESGRSRDDIEISCPLFMVMGDTDQAIDERVLETKKQIAFYGSTPAYRAVLETTGCGDLQPLLTRLSKEGRWDAMADLIDEEVFNSIALVGRPEQMPDLVRDRFGGLIDRASSYFGWPIDDPERLSEIVNAFCH